MKNKLFYAIPSYLLPILINVVLLFVSIPCWGAGDRLLIKNDRHLITARYEGNRITFILEAVGDHTNHLGGQFPNVDFASIRVDVNRNGKVDEKVDGSYGVASGTSGRICPQYLITETSSTPCGGLKSNATLKAGFRATPNEAVPHPVWEFGIPIKELSRDSRAAHLVFSFYEPKRGYTRYPATRSANVTFSEIIVFSLTPNIMPKISKIHKIQPIRREMLRNLKPIPLVAMSRKLISNDRHVITAKKTGERMTFILEAVRDRTNNLKGQYPNLDFASIRVDVNRNGKVDKKIDVAYGVASGTSERICPQYLITETSFTPCGGFHSNATLKAGFRATPNGSVPHPIWEFGIPIKELSSDPTTAHLMFQFHESGQGFTWYPATWTSNAPFSKALALDMSSLTVVDTGIAAKTRDTKPPKISIIDPAVDSSGRFLTKARTIEIRGMVEDDSGIFDLLVNNAEANVSDSGEFQYQVRLGYGENRIRVQAADIHENWAVKNFLVVRESTEKRGVDVEELPTEDLLLGTYYALLIAVEDYTNPNITDLDKPLSDARTLRDALIGHYRFEPENVTLLGNADEDTIIQALIDLNKKITDKDNLVIFFAGHGKWNEQIGQGYWLPRDAKDNPASWISNSDIRYYVKGIRSKHTLLISDACFSGGIFKIRGEEFAGSDRSVKELYKLPSRKAMTSGTMTTVPDRSVFLGYLTTRLRENTNLWLTADQLFASFRHAVINNSPNIPQYGVIFDTGDEGGEFVFLRREK